MLISAALAVGLLVASSRPWVVVALPDPLVGTERLAVPGGQAAPVVAALALVALACAGALTLARRIGSVVAVVGLAVAGLAAAAMSSLVLVDPERAARTAVAEATGLTPASVDPGAGGAEATGWPVLTVVLALLLVVVALAGVRGRRSWQSARRIDPASATSRPPAHTEGASVDSGTSPAPADDWDALTRGEDPTRDG